MISWQTRFFNFSWITSCVKPNAPCHMRFYRLTRIRRVFPRFSKVTWTDFLSLFVVFFPLIVIGRCNSSNGSYLVYLCSYVWSGFIVLLGIFLNVYSKNETRINAWLAQNGSQYLKLFLRRQKGTPFMENVWYEMRSSIYHGAWELCQDIEMSFCGVEKFPETGKILRNISLVR